MRDLLSSESDFAAGTLCDFRKDPLDEIAKLDADAYDYDDDSDLDELEDGYFVEGGSQPVTLQR